MRYRAVGSLVVTLLVLGSTPLVAEEPPTLTVGDRVLVDTPSGWIKGVVVAVDEASILVAGPKETLRIPHGRAGAVGAATEEAPPYKVTVAGGLVGAVVGLAAGYVMAGVASVDCERRCPDSTKIMLSTSAKSAAIGAVLAAALDLASSRDLKEKPRAPRLSLTMAPRYGGVGAAVAVRF